LRTKVRVFGGKFKWAKLGRPRGIGKNIEILRSMAHGDTLWALTWPKCACFLTAAKRRRIKLSYRQIPGTDEYMIKRL